jgi:hypothetical protein
MNISNASRVRDSATQSGDMVYGDGGIGGGNEQFPPLQSTAAVMTPRIRRARLLAAWGTTIALVLTGCAHVHGDRILQIRTFEAGYFEALQRAAYDEAYNSLHTELKTVVTEERYRIYFTTITDTLGPMTAWQELPNTQDHHLALLDPERHRDPLPPDKPQAMLEARYRLKFQQGDATLIIRTGWEEGRLVIRRQFLCCMAKPLYLKLQARAAEVGVGDLYGVKPAVHTPPQTPNSTTHGGPIPLKP